jgi:UDPglucose--hexose-1-phosphate uridylyltransferase
MPIEYEMRDGALVWIRNPVTGVTSYVVDLRAKSFAFTLGERSAYNSDGPPLAGERIREATERCPFCPGNENLATREIFRITPAEMPDWTGAASREGDRWVVRVFNNLFPRIPAELTGGRNESYIVVEDPRHFIADPRSSGDLMHTGALGAAHFRHLLEADVRVMRLSRENRAVRSIVVRKNQGRESGASQPHLHQQIIGAPGLFPVVAAEARAQAEIPGLFDEIIALMDRLGLIIENAGSVVSYASPIGAFPRSYDVVMPQHRGVQLTDLSAHEMGEFAGAIYRILRVMGPLPLDYEIHQGDELPLHAHLNARLYPYSNVAGTLNLPSTLLASAAAIRSALSRERKG